ncbi:MAG: hypothetical protein HKL90_02045 [Elusimicrobia bacterium]|nr:hypothetical protein [Elusimicrobiota bacterium]
MMNPTRLLAICVLAAATACVAARARADDALLDAYARTASLAKASAQKARAADAWEADAGSDDAELRQGLRLLFKNVRCAKPEFCLNARTQGVMVANALAFKRRFDELASAPAPRVEWKPIGGHVREFEFDSLIQRGGHPSDKVFGFVYFPQAYDSGLRFPATLLIHKLGDDLDSEKQIAQLAVDPDRGVVMLIYLPHFGPRKGQASFITKVPEDFERNVLQSLLDIHQSYLVLKSLPCVKPDDIGLMGLSLGGMISLISAGIDPVFDRYATNVGGGDLANIITYRKTGDVDSQTGRALKEIDWSVDQARFFLSRFDAITWSLKVKGKSILMINAKSDELVSKTLSVDPLVEGYEAAGSKVRLIMHDGTHVFHAKDVGYWDALTKVIDPMADFIGGRGPVVSRTPLD